MKIKVVNLKKEQIETREGAKQLREIWDNIDYLIPVDLFMLWKEHKEGVEKRMYEKIKNGN